MSIDEAAALKAVRDGLEGRNVPIVHEEIRVVLAMALERDVLKARAETAERDLDIARGLIARLGDTDALESLWALLRYERARVAELERERDAAVTLRRGIERDLSERVAELERAQDAAFRDAHRAEADAARLREALKKYGDHEPRCDYGDAIASIPCSCGFRTALASAPRAEPTPRDMRVAEAGYEHLTPWRLRAVEAYLQAIADPEVHPWDWDKVGERLTRDLKERTLDGIHLRALWDDADRDGDYERAHSAANPWAILGQGETP